MSTIKTLPNTPGRKHCVVCRRTGGILLCHGCQLTFCAKHVHKHREELANQLEDLMQTHRHLRQDIEQSPNEYLYSRKIDQWESESIKRIQKAAEIARANLRQIVDRSKRRLTRIARDLAVELNTSWKVDDFAEKDLLRWTKQLNELRLEIKSAYSVQLTEDQRYPIYPITLNNTNHQQRSMGKQSANVLPQECFAKTTSSATIENHGLIVRHIGPDSNFAHILGKQLYSQGRHTIRFRILQSSSPYTMFFGCISSALPQTTINYNSSTVVGWFGYNEIYRHGVWSNSTTLHGYESNEIQTDDTLDLVLDCDHRRIELIHQRINRTYRLAVDIDKAPFPWQFLVVLVHEDDSVKILSEK